MLMKMSEYEFGGGDEDRVTEWEVGLPGVDDLTPLSQLLIPAELASAFSISPEPYRTAVEVNRASQTTFSTIRGVNHTTAKGSLFETTNPDPDPDQDPMVLEADENEITNRDGSGSDLKRSRNKDDECCVEIEVEEADSALRNNENDDDESAAAEEARTVKRPRLVWTPQLHKRFVDVVGHLGIKNAVPKTIMQLMNVEGLTRENVASHLQKYRLYLKRQQGGSSGGGGGGGGGGLFSDGPSSTSTSTSDHLFASTTPHMPNYHMPTMMPQMLGHMGMPPMGGGHHHHPYNMFQQQQQQSMNSNYQYGSHPVAPNEN